MDDKITIEPMTRSDAEGAYRVFETTIPAAFEQEGIGSLLDDIQHEIAHKRALIHTALQPDHNKEANVFFLVAKMGKSIVGTISYGPCGEEIRECTDQRLNDIGELGSLYVLPEVQGQGIGSALILALGTELQRLGIQQFCLDSGYRIAQQKWQRKFGEPYVVAKNYWGEGTDHMVWLCKVQDFIVKVK
ncbi:GNAT family N-acetyltransferase [Paenibacillus xylanexedens]|uniref:GNAT family N-acetyltransferase n=1 Tax=Paenibacillus xylanexedens TaxID=528191 RepID=UPI000A5FD796|nr:GNAT family N-acetyltransferase [Paenibacillus xylanexedens]